VKLHNVAKKFDKTVASDAYTPATTFKCQLDPLTLFSVDGTAVKRRQLSTAPDVSIPSRRAIQIGSQVYVIGDVSPDYHNGTPIRNNYVIQGADHLAQLNTIAAELAGTARTTSWASLDYNKHITDQRDSADYQAQYMLFFGKGESIPELVYLNSKWYLKMIGYESVSGIQSVLANELAEPAFETITYTNRTYVPATDTWTETTSSVKIFRVRWTEYFRYLTKASENYERGDMQVFVLKSAATPKVSDKLTLSDGVWTILSMQDEGLTWSLHARR